MKEERRKQSNKKKAVRLIVLAAAASALVIAGLVAAVLAAFTNSLKAQRTIAAYDEFGDRFSSNYLLKSSSEDNVRIIYTTSAESRATAVVNICNYEQGKTVHNDSDVTYTLTARFVKWDNTLQEYVAAAAADVGAYTATVVKEGGTLALNSSNTSASFTGEFLSGSGINKNVYTLSFDPSFISGRPNLYVEMVAEPVGSGNPTLRGIFKPELRATGASNHWTGEFRDDTASDPADYDGFNYLVTGMGSGTCSITWDTTKVTLSDESIRTLLKISGAVLTTDTITFPVDSNDNSRFDLQFYKVNITTETWTEMNEDVVAFTFS
ncbi:MAG: hypothetical protein J6112_06355 [Clostridia bacterium]|nr:hypothetical protein [Clostridia bacterium]